ncbi:hypothetical protein NDU88_006577 [Pleurodeles waltl]|uniref:Uncharacterized protein n=1 Tax=Pleurodeles waltl TaxID=8319 RepID=A0AAV7TY10_PLEWA|nr:hypothetical protein NDU88_006577 [Pleurodeles waltl]
MGETPAPPGDGSRDLRHATPLSLGRGGDWAPVGACVCPGDTSERTRSPGALTGKRPAPISVVGVPWGHVQERTIHALGIIRAPGSRW